MNIKTIEEYEARTNHLDSAIKSYLLSGYNKLFDPTRILPSLKDRSAVSLKATNRLVRQKFALAGFSAIEALARKNNRKLFLVTLCPEFSRMPIGEARDFDHAILVRWAKKQLRAYRYVAIVDVALYKDVPVLAYSKDGWVSFHIHAIVWDCDEAELDARIATLNRDHRPIVPGPMAMHFRPLSAKGAPGRTLYAMKPPLEEYRVMRQRSDHDPVTGEVRPTLLPEFKQKSRPLRPADAVRMTLTMLDRDMPSLIFGGRKGERIAAQIVQTASAEIEAIASGLARRDQAFVRVMERAAAGE